MRIIASNVELGKCAVKRCERDANHIVQGDEAHEAACEVHAHRVANLHDVSIHIPEGVTPKIPKKAGKAK